MQDQEDMTLLGFSNATGELVFMAPRAQAKIDVDREFEDMHFALEPHVSPHRFMTSERYNLTATLREDESGTAFRTFRSKSDV